jgi:peptidoglycan/LPS O-acetylase OafA/YrhL
MLQRIQTIYLIIAVIISGVVAFIVPFWNEANGEMRLLLDLLQDGRTYYRAIPILFVLSAIGSLVAVFKYKNRTRQIIINRINIVINFLLLGIIVYHLLTLPGEIDISEKGIGVFIPLLVIVFLALANKAILKDEKLVKSVDRLR